MKIRTLKPAHIRCHLQTFLDIAADIEGEYWTEEHFLRDLPEKWQLSFALWAGERPVAYAVLSRKAPDHLHLHHFMVARDVRGHGLGQRMAQEMEARARACGCRRLTLKVAANNEDARRFYGRLGYHEMGRDDAYVTLGKALLTTE